MTDQPSQHARNAAASLIAGSFVGSSDGATYIAQTPTLDETAQAFAKFEDETLDRVIKRITPHDTGDMTREDMEARRIIQIILSMKGSSTRSTPDGGAHG